MTADTGTSSESVPAEAPGESARAEWPERSSTSDSLTEQLTTKLYGLFQGRCAICKKAVVKESEVSGKAYNLGKRSHMVSRSDDGPRGDGSVPKSDRGHLRNHVLLCGTCHDEVDKDEEAWPGATTSGRCLSNRSSTAMRPTASTDSCARS